MTANTNAGSIPRTTGDASLPQKSTESAVCAICGVRRADGMNADGRPLCQSCATHARTFACDGGHATREFETAKTQTENVVESFAGVDEANVTVRHNHHYFFVDTVERAKLPADLVDRIERKTGLRLCAVEPYAVVKDGVRARFRFDDRGDALERLASEFQNRLEQSNISKKEYEQRGDDRAADFEAVSSRTKKRAASSSRPSGVRTMTDPVPEEDLQEALEDIPDADPDSLTLYEDGYGHFVIHSNEEEQDIDEIDAALDGTGYERDGILNVPGMTQQNVTPVETGENDE